MQSRHRTAVVLVALLAVTGMGSAVGAGQADTYVVEQGTTCAELTPLSHENMTAEEFYGYTTNESGPAHRYSANTPLGIETRNNDTSSLFLYRGPENLSLVVLHDGPNESGGGAATLNFTGLPGDGAWLVKDDPTNESVEQWNRTGPTEWSVDWGWRAAHTDGGAFGGLGDEFEVTVDPAFNEGAGVDPVTPGNVTAWRALSDRDGSLDVYALDMDEPVTVRTGSCP